MELWRFREASADEHGVLRGVPIRDLRPAVCGIAACDIGESGGNFWDAIDDETVGRIDDSFLTIGGNGENREQDCGEEKMRLHGVPQRNEATFIHRKQLDTQE